MTLIEAVRAALRRGHYSSRTEEAYVHWIRAFVRFHHRRHPREMGAPEITAFLNELALVRRTSASTQNQALCALVFLYRRVLQIEMPELFGLHRARRPVHLPAVLGRRDVQALLDKLKPPFLLMGEMFYGSGLRLMECVSLRIKDVDLDRHQVLVRGGKGNKDRAALLPVRAREALRAQIAHTAERHRRELASRPCIDPATGRMVLHHLHETAVQKAVQQAARQAGITRRVNVHTLRHSFATALLEAGTDIRTIQTLLGHQDVRTTMIYTHIVDRGPLGVVSPLDR